MAANLLQPPAPEPRPGSGLRRLTEKPVEARLAALLLMLAVAFNADVPLGPGEHQVRLEYRASPLRGALLLAGLAGLILIALAEWRRADLARRIAITGWRRPLAGWTPPGRRYPRAGAA